MPVSIARRLGLGLLCALVTGAAWLTFSAPAGASVGADVRVVSTVGKSLAQLRQFTDTVSIKTDPNADCFGEGSGGSGRSVTVSGPTALGAVVDAAATQDELSPVSVTDKFGFALGICGFGERRADATHFWYFKINHVESSLGGDQVHVGGGDDVLWYLIPTSACPPPDFFCEVSDLTLEAPPRVQPGVPFLVHVTAYSRTGARSNAVGATVGGGDAPVVTGPDGTATMTIGTPGTSFLYATRGADIPTQVAPTCTAFRLRKCPRERGLTIAGTDQSETLTGTGGKDQLLARNGDDTVLAKGGLRDTVACGGGNDVAKVDRRDRVDKRSCERVVRAKKKHKKHKKKGK